MKANERIYRIWAPQDSPWSAWAKPVLFSGLFAGSNQALETLEVSYKFDSRTMLVLDIPGKQGVEVALAFARIGYRPVPLYNGVYTLEGQMLVDCAGIQRALNDYAATLRSLRISANAPPAFMLDADRMAFGGKVPGKYDNRWCVFPQDMPSALFLKKQGISRVSVRAARIQTDLQHILYSYQKEGIQIFHWDNKSGTDKEITLSKPIGFAGLFYRIRLLAGLTRNAAGGFGGKVPEPMDGGGGGFYGGFG
ncbi:MAG: hypothetical protein FWE69_01190 [Clostridiales bacterium]|nr:hypothetical protein [Clostridiales bacterium]